jgi:hypothetical protein
VFGVENVTIGGEFIAGAPDFVGPFDLTADGFDFGGFEGLTVDSPLSVAGSEFGTAETFANFKPPTVLENVKAGLYTLQDKAGQAFDQLVVKATAVVKDPAFLQKIVDKSIVLALSPGQVSGQALLGVVTSSATEVSKNPTPVSSPDFVGPPAPRPALTISPSTVDAAIAAADYSCSAYFHERPLEHLNDPNWNGADSKQLGEQLFIYSKN